MSEPVGNSPRRAGDIPSNSHKAREKEAPVAPEEPREPVEKIVEGKVVTRKQPWWKRASRSMIAEDAATIRESLVTDVVVPALRNLIRDAIVGSVDQALYGRGRSSRIGRDREPLRTRYDRMSDRDRDRGEPRRMMSREARARHDFDDIILDDRGEAVDVVEALIARVAKFGSASVSDLYDYLGVTGSFADQRWGWTDLRDADVRQSRGGWLLELPQPEPLR